MTEPEIRPEEWMAGFPPPPERTVRFADGSYYRWPQLAWSFAHMEQLVPTKAAWRGPGAARPLPVEPRALDHLEIQPTEGPAMSWAEVMNSTHTDALAVLHRGRLVFEEYFGVTGPHDRHLLMSCNKSMVGTVAECLIHEGVLDDTALVPTVLPELADSAWAEATIRQVMDMTVAMRFHEDYLDPGSDVWTFLRATGMIPADPDTPTLFEFLPTVAPEGAHGEAFAYREPNIFVLGWVVRRVTGTDLTTLASELVWRHIGAEHDWLYMVDITGAETTAAATLRDFVRFGELIQQGGEIAGRRVLPPGVVSAVLGGGDPEVFARGGYDTLPGWSYRSQWWYRHVDGRICPVARGAHGQVLYLDPANELVVARFGSSPRPPSALLDHVMWPMIDAITAELVG